MADTSRLHQLSEALTYYGKTSQDLLHRVKALGRSVVDRLPGYLGDHAQVFAVPPQGDWQPDNYHDQAFSTWMRGLVKVGPMQMGIAICVPHIRDSGKTWIRTAVEFVPEGGVLIVGPPLGRSVRIEPGDTDGADRICELVFEHLVAFFRDPASQATEPARKSIGFHAPSIILES